jgi:hypothetical protein
MRFLGWYLAVVLAAYALSTSWSLGLAGQRMAAAEQHVEQLSADLDSTRAKLAVLDLRQRCAASSDECMSHS